MTPIPASHADHDPLAVAAHAAGDATGSELDDALALVAGCADCAALHHDLRAIALAMPALPAPVRTRDFRLTPEQAASLRPPAWRRLLAPLAGPRFAFAGPLGTGLATLGIAGFLLAGTVGMPLAGTAAAPQGQPESTDLTVMLVPSPMPAAASEAPAAGTPSIEGFPGNEAPAGAGSGTGYGPVESGDGAITPGADPGALTAASGASPNPDADASMGPSAADPKASLPSERSSLAAPGEEYATAGEVDQVPPAAPGVTPLTVLAVVLLVAGTLIGGLRLIARRAA